MGKVTDNKERYLRRNQKIRRKFNQYVTEKRYAIDYALELLEDDFMPLKSTTIWLIVSQTGHYKDY